MTAETIIFPDAAAVTIAYLRAAFEEADDTDTEVGTRVPSGASRFVTVELAGSENTSIVVQRSTLLIACWVNEGTSSHQDAQELAQLTRGLIKAMQGTTQAGARIYKVADAPAASGLADSPDTITGKIRYPFHIAISMRGGATLDDSAEIDVPSWFHGTQGPVGPQGPPGGAFTFEQDIAATTWTIEHDLGYRPAVTVVDTLDRAFEGAVTYIDDNNVQVDFAVAVTGKAYLS